MAATDKAQTQVEPYPPVRNRMRLIPAVFDQAMSDAASLYESRVELLSQPAAVLELDRLDNRLDACLDVLRIQVNDFLVAGKMPVAISSPGEIFLATVLVLENRNTHILKQLLSLAEAESALRPGMFDAFMWVPLSFIQPLIPHLLGAASVFFRQLGLHCCRQHQVLADTELERIVTQPDHGLQVAALNTIGDIGLLDLLPHCLTLMKSSREDVQFAAARACLMLGDRSRAIPALMQLAQSAKALQQPAVSLLAMFLPLANAQPFLSTLARQGYDKRLLVQLAGELGDPANIPALLRMMPDRALSRIAGRAFTTITGLNLEEQNLDRAPVPGLAGGPNDDPQDEDVSSDPDEGLPWPDHEKLTLWWANNGARFAPGVRYVAGEEMTRERCMQVLRFGNLCQRQLAALQLKAMAPAFPLFLSDAPVWRQQKRLAQLLAHG